MQLSLHADYACRVLMYLATNQGEIASIQEIAESFDISENHLIKIVHQLGKRGFLVTKRGRGGGIRLARLPRDITIGHIVRQMEPHFNIVECFDSEVNQCPLVRVCQLKLALSKARDAFLSILDTFTLEDITVNRRPLAKAMSFKYVGT